MMKTTLNVVVSPFGQVKPFHEEKEKEETQKSAQHLILELLRPVRWNKVMINANLHWEPITTYH